MPSDQDASKCDDPTDDEYYHGYGCTIVSTGQKIPIAAEFTESKQAPEETAMRVTCLTLCPLLVVVITNYERGDNPGSAIITV